LLCGLPYQTTSPSTLIFSQPNKLRPPSVTIQRACSELDLCNQLRFWLRTVSHLLLGRSPLRSFLFWQMKNALSRKRNLFIIREDSFNRIDLVSRTPGENNRW
jgi:hypothetical protein